MGALLDTCLPSANLTMPSCKGLIAPGGLVPSRMVEAMRRLYEATRIKDRDQLASDHQPTGTKGQTRA